jgi:hypothetical protein
MKKKTSEPEAEEYEEYKYYPQVTLVLIFIFMLVVCVGYSFIFINEWRIHNINFIFVCDNNCESMVYNQFAIIPIIFVAYILYFFLMVIFITASNGKVVEAFAGSFFGCVFGLISGFIIGVLYMLIIRIFFGATNGFNSSLIIISIITFGVMFFMTLVFGLIYGFGGLEDDDILKFPYAYDDCCDVYR